MDLWAISARLGSYGAGCIAVVDPQLDIGTLHRTLAKQGAPGVVKVRTSTSLVYFLCSFLTYCKRADSSRIAKEQQMSLGRLM
jgi:hypothetical protein